MKSKWGSQGQCRNAVNHIKNFDNDDPGCKTFFLLALRPEKNVLQPGSSLTKFLMWSTAFLHWPWPPPFDFTSFLSQPFSGFGCNFFTAKMFLAVLIINACSYIGTRLYLFTKILFVAAWKCEELVLFTR